MQVLIPIEKIKEVNESSDMNKLEQKYIEIVTKDDSEFWFVGFLRYVMRNSSEISRNPIPWLLDSN